MSYNLIEKLNRMEHAVADAERQRIKDGSLAPENSIYHQGARVVDGEVVSENDFIWTGITMLMALFSLLVLFTALSELAMSIVPKVADIPKPWLAAVALVATPVIAELCYRWREITRKVPYALAEIALGTVMVARLFLQADLTRLENWLAIAAGVLVAADGRARLARAAAREMPV